MVAAHHAGVAADARIGGGRGDAPAHLVQRRHGGKPDVAHGKCPRTKNRPALHTPNRPSSLYAQIDKLIEDGAGNESLEVVADQNIGRWLATCTVFHDANR